VAEQKLMKVINKLTHTYHEDIKRLIFLWRSTIMLECLRHEHDCMCHTKLDCEEEECSYEGVWGLSDDELRKFSLGVADKGLVWFHGGF
jgi:hypothetical protein